MSFQNSYLEQSTSQNRQSYTYDGQLPHSSFGTLLAYITLSLVFVYYVVTNLGLSAAPISELVWELLVRITPYRLITASQSSTSEAFRERDDGSGNVNMMQRHAAKSEALRNFLGFDGRNVFATLYRTPESSRVTGAQVVAHEAPPGLGNWDNSCYQNSVIQALASLHSLSEYLRASEVGYRSEKSRASASALCDITQALNNPTNSGKRLWTPSQLKSMSSWQQQDAQEYLSKVLEDIGRQTPREQDPGLSNILKPIVPEDGDSESRSVNSKIGGQTYSVANSAEVPTSTQTCYSADSVKDVLRPTVQRIPMEGLLAQRVGCMQCRYTEGLSLIPFTCLTVPLGNNWLHDIRECLDAYTTLETIDDVECGKCTLLKSKEQLEKLLREQSSEPNGSDSIGSPLQSRELHALASKRLATVNTSLENEDFEDKTLLNVCKISPRNRVTTTKSRQAVIARAPQTLIIHVNRSVFDERTGLQRKNHANVQFPEFLDLDAWRLGSEHCSSPEQEESEEWSLEPETSMLANKDPMHSSGNCNYRLRAMITHYGRHENGHYTCYRRYPSVSSSEVDTDIDKLPKERWWRLSDENVEMVSEDEVLAQGNVFILFYERAKESSLDPFIHESKANMEGANVETPIESSALPGETEPYPLKESSEDIYPELVGDASSAALMNEAMKTSNETLSLLSDSAEKQPSQESRPTPRSRSDVADHRSRHPQTEDTPNAVTTEPGILDGHIYQGSKLEDTSKSKKHRIKNHPSIPNSSDTDLPSPNSVPVSQSAIMMSGKNNRHQHNVLMAH
ncbi:MAG: hypothetical protein M1835_000318 [Candelina submexicana]|nr:MAG: hypothetical protein M1835_000318 [Candelina submexicana]